MKACPYSMPEACPETSDRVETVSIEVSPTHLQAATAVTRRWRVETVSIEVSPTHPLLLLKRALPWEVITEVMTCQWRQSGKNVDGEPGLPWDVSLYLSLTLPRHMDLKTSNINRL
jgi:hypothetical protein